MMINHNTRYPRVEFRVGGLAAPLAARGDDAERNETARRDLARYYEALDRELQSLAFTHAEASLLADALNGTLWDVQSIPLLWAQVDDAIRLNDLAAKWGVPGEAFVARLRDLTYTQSLAIIDGCERAWRSASDGLDAALRESGLTG